MYKRPYSFFSCFIQSVAFTHGFCFFALGLEFAVFKTICVMSLTYESKLSNCCGRKLMLVCVGYEANKNSCRFFEDYLRHLLFYQSDYLSIVEDSLAESRMRREVKSDGTSKTGPSFPRQTKPPPRKLKESPRSGSDRPTLCFFTDRVASKILFSGTRSSPNAGAGKAPFNAPTTLGATALRPSG